MQELLEVVLTLRRAQELESILALDWYMVPPDADDPASQWTHTATGDLVYRKYFTNNAPQVNAAGSKLSDHLADVVRKHPRYSAADAVLVVPGTKHTFGERLARSVASRTGKEKIETKCLATDHAEAKAGHTSFDLEPYSVPRDVSGKAVIIVDDVFRSGRTMRSVAASARSAGACAVLGLVACRTMRRS
jgi:pyrimidine operon attenuation protein/uracil phosphoribosyltransferase